jgi:hypothetical protein
MGAVSLNRPMMIIKPMGSYRETPLHGKMLKYTENRAMLRDTQSRSRHSFAPKV